jgi:hypothetical protein
VTRQYKIVDTLASPSLSPGFRLSKSRNKSSLTEHAELSCSSTLCARKALCLLVPQSRRALSTQKDHSDESEHDSPPVFDAFGTKDPYDWQDPFRFRSQLTEEECAVQDAATAFCQGELLPRIVEANRHEITLDHALMQEMGEVGMLGPTLPECYGGSGVGYVATVS